MGGSKRGKCRCEHTQSGSVDHADAKMTPLPGFEFVEPLIQIVGSGDDSVGNFKYECQCGCGNSGPGSSFEKCHAEATFNFGHPLRKRRLTYAQSMCGVSPGGCSCGFANVEKLVDGKIR